MKLEFISGTFHKLFPPFFALSQDDERAIFCFVTLNGGYYTWSLMFNRQIRHKGSKVLLSQASFAFCVDLRKCFDSGVCLFVFMNIRAQVPSWVDIFQW